MLSVVLAVVGVLLVLGVFVDAFATTLVVAAGAGPFTRRLSGFLWRFPIRLHKQDTPSLFLTVAGTVLLVVTVLTWVVGLWLGWTLVFLSGDDVLVDVSSGRPVGVADTVYFTGFNLFTLGVGDIVAATAAWRLISAIAGFTGLFLVTLAITYLISVVSAVVARRALAIHVTALGESATDMVLRAWSGPGWSGAFTQQLVTITGKVASSAEQHLAYPALHYFHTPQRLMSAPSALACLDDALLLLTHGIEPASRPDLNATSPLRHVIRRFLDTAGATSDVREDVGPPPAPELGSLADGGLPVVHRDEFLLAVDAERERRTHLRRLVNSDGWSWPQ